MSLSVITGFLMVRCPEMRAHVHLSLCPLKTVLSSLLQEKGTRAERVESFRRGDLPTLRDLLLDALE